MMHSEELTASVYTGIIYILFYYIFWFDFQGHKGKTFTIINKWNMINIKREKECEY